MSDNLDPERFDDGDTNIKFSDLYIPLSILGNGAFGTVVSVQSKQDFRQYAVKVVNKKTLKKEKCNNFLKEAEILSQLNHPNIVKFINIIETETRILMVMELIRGGTLTQLITDRVDSGKFFSDEEAAIIIRSIFNAMFYIHSEGIVHRDLKPENILLKDKADLSSIKICDFGLSAQFEENDQGKSFQEACGTRLFMAPELWNKKLYSKPVDIYSCGIILYLLLSGGRHPIWTGKDTISSYKYKVENPNWTFPSTFTNYSKHLFLKLVDLSPVERYTSDQAGNHPWITRRFTDPFPMTSSEHIRAFRQTQTFTYIIKALYMMECKMKHPDRRIPVENDHKKKIIECQSKFAPVAKPVTNSEPSTIGSTLKNILASFQIVQENNKDLDPEPEPKTPPKKTGGSTPQAPKTDPEGRPKSRGFLSPRANPTVSPFAMSKKNSENLPPKIKPMQPVEGEPQKFNLKRSFTNLPIAFSADKANNMSSTSSDEEKVLKPQSINNNLTSFLLTKDDDINKTSIENNLHHFSQISQIKGLRSELLDREPDHVKDFSFTIGPPEIASAHDIVKHSSDFIKAIDDELPDYKVMKPPKPRRLSSMKKKEKSTKSKENGHPPLPKAYKLPTNPAPKPTKILSATRKRSEPPLTTKKRKDPNSSNISFVRDESPLRVHSNFVIPTSPAVKIITAIPKSKEKNSNSANSSLVFDELESKPKKLTTAAMNILSEIDPQIQINQIPRRAGQASKRGRGSSQTPSENQRNSSLTFLKNKRAVLYDQPDCFNVSKVSILPAINNKKKTEYLDYRN